MKDAFPRLPVRLHNLRMEFIGAVEKSDIDHARKVLTRAAAGDIDQDTISYALNLSIATDDSAMFSLLLPHAQDAPQQTLNDFLVDAADALDARALRFLLKMGADPLYDDAKGAKRVLGFLQPGHTAARDRDAASCLHVLIESGADETGALSQTALVCAMRRNIPPLVHYLLKKGTTLEPRWSGVGYNPLVIAARFGFTRLAEHIHQTNPPETLYYHAAIHAAAEKGNVRLVEQLLSYGFDATTPGIDLPFAAAVGGQLEYLKALRAKGLTTDLTDVTLMEAVISHDDAPMLDYMLQNNASLITAHDMHSRVAHINNGARPYPAILRVLEKWDARGTVYSCDDATPPTLEDARAQGLILKLAQARRFNEIMTVHGSAQDTLNAHDVCQTDAHGNRVIDILGAHNALSKLFDPEKWHGKKAQMMALLDLVPPVYLGQIDHMNLRAEHLHEVLAQKARQNRPPRL